MRSPRSLAELGCRLAAFALLGWLLGIALTPSVGRRTERATASTLADALPAWTRAGGHIALHANLDAVPQTWAIDWLAALARAGRPVSWSGSPPAAAIAADPLADPAGGARVDLVAAPAMSVVLNDDVSTIDSLRVAATGTSVSTPVLVGSATAVAGAQSFGTPPIDSVRLGTVVVMGRASWEGKFVAAALEERGWPVAGLWSVAPTVDVSQGTVVLDTARVSAVVILDSTASSSSAAVERFVRSGGGLILAGSAGLAPAFTPLAPARVAERVATRARTVDTLDRASGGFWALTALRADAIALERREGRIAVAARRVGAGRVIQLGFDESWRWRMAGGPGAEAAHREWWSRMVGAVAYAPVIEAPANPLSRPGSVGPLDGGLREGSTSSAPLAMLIDRLGPARRGAPADYERWTPDSRVLLALMLVLLVIEWASRRLRGAR